MVKMYKLTPDDCRHKSYEGIIMDKNFKVRIMDLDGGGVRTSITGEYYHKQPIYVALQHYNKRELEDTAYRMGIIIEDAECTRDALIESLCKHAPLKPVMEELYSHLKRRLELQMKMGRGYDAIWEESSFAIMRLLSIVYRNYSGQPWNMSIRLDNNVLMLCTDDPLTNILEGLAEARRLTNYGIELKNGSCKRGVDITDKVVKWDVFKWDWRLL